MLVAPAYPLLKVTITPESGVFPWLGAVLMVPVSVPHAGADVQDGNLYDAMRVDQLNPPFVF